MKAEYKLVCPSGWRFLRLGEYIRPGDRYCDIDQGGQRWYATGEKRRKLTASFRDGNGPYIRRLTTLTLKRIPGAAQLPPCSDTLKIAPARRGRRS